LAATIIGSAMAFIDGTVVNVALPQIQQRLGATAVDAQWIVEAYALFLAALILVGGSLGDHYGRRRTFLLDIGIFAVASVACALGRGRVKYDRARILQPGRYGSVRDRIDDAAMTRVSAWIGHLPIRDRTR